MKGLSKRQVQLRFGFNARAVEVLVERGILRVLPGSTFLRPQIDPETVSALKVRQHYVVCQVCGAFQAQITTKHLQFCGGLNLGEYVRRLPTSPVMSELCSKNKAKSPEQKRHQSVVLKKRFQTQAGEITRAQISEAAWRMQAGEYGQRAAEHLRAINQSPEGRDRVSQQMQDLYASGWNAARVWHASHREESLRRAAVARRFIGRKRTHPHMQFKAALIAAGLDSFETECEVGYYAIDEARPDIKLAVEIDGCYWHGCPVCGFPGVPGTQHHDKSKETYLRNRGWAIIRIRSCEMRRDLGACVQTVREAVGRLEGQYVGSGNEPSNSGSLQTGSA